MKIKAIYDNGGKTFDRYTVYYSPKSKSGYNMFEGRGMSAHPYHPQGFGQWIYGQPGKHNGKKIAFAKLPKDCQKVIKADLGCDYIPFTIKTK